MPIIKSAIKRVRQSQKHQARNVIAKKAINAKVKLLVATIDKKDKAKVTAAFKAAVSEIDRAVKKKILHKNTAARKKSRLARLASGLIEKGTAKRKPKKTAAKTRVSKSPKAKSSAKKK